MGSEKGEGNFLPSISRLLIDHIREIFGHLDSELVVLRALVEQLAGTIEHIRQPDDVVDSCAARRIEHGANTIALKEYLLVPSVPIQDR